MSKDVASALRDTLISPNVRDSNFEDANIVDAVSALANAAFGVRNAITPNVPGAQDNHGGHVESLTEAVMSVGSSLDDIASSIRELAEAVRESKG